MANVLEWVGPPAPQLISVPTPGRGPRPYPVGEVEQLSWVAPHAYGYFHHAKLGFALWIMGAALTGIATAYWYTRAGKEKLKTRQIRGQQVVRAPQLAHEITLFNQEQAKAKNRPDHLPANLVGIPYPMDAEQEHTLITGSPGAGKSVAMHRLIRSVRARGDRGVVYDPELEYIAQHYNPETDLILNPFDERSPAWSPFHDATDHVEWDRLAHGLFKDPKSGDPYWSNVARSLFSWTCFTLKERDPNVSLDTALNMLFGSTKRLERLLVGTPAHKHISGGAGPRVSSIESVLVEGVTPLVYLLGKGEPFSIRRWVNQERRTPGLLFLSAPETHADTLRPLLGFWSEIVISALLSRNADARLNGGVTTKPALDLERGIVSRIEQGKNTAPALMTLAEAGAALTHAAGREGGIVLSDGQRAGAEKLLTSHDRYVGVQGLAGVGKTKMFEVVREVAAERGVEIAGLAPTHQAAEALSKGAGIESGTVESFLQRYEGLMTRAETGGAGAGLDQARESWAKKTLLVDESSMLSNSQADRLMRVSETLQIPRIIFVGDEKQLGSPEAGAPWRLVLEEGLDHARMTEIRRQKDPEVRAAVEQLAQGAPAQALRALGSRVVQVGRDANDDKLAEAAHTAWAQVKERGGDAPVIVPTHSLREKVSQLIRGDLAARGVLTGPTTSVPTLSHVRMTRAESYQAASYREGQILVLHSGIKEAGLTKGATVTVVGRDERNDRLIVASDRDRRTTIDLTTLRDQRKSKFEAYRSKDLDVQQGDRLVWERRDADRGFKTGEGFTVERLGRDSWDIRGADGKQHTLKTSDPALRFTGYAYAETADRSQGSTYQNVVAVLASTHGEGANQARAYVQVSRTAETLTLVTNDTALLAMRLNKQDGQNLIAMHEAKLAGAELAALASSLPDHADRSNEPLATLAADGLDGSSKDQTDLARSAGADGPEKDDGADKPLPGTLEADKPKESEPAKEAEKDKSFDKAVEINSPAMGL